MNGLGLMDLGESNMKKNFKSYVLLGFIIIVAGGLAALLCIYMGEAIGYGSSIESQDGFVAMIVGLLSGSLTSTPAFSAAKDTVLPEYESLVSVGHGIAYIFGVIGVVLFVQLVPKFMKADMAVERDKIAGGNADTGEEPVEVKETKKLIESVKKELDAEGLPYSDHVEIGVMIETPAAALQARELAEQVDFFSVG